MLPQVNAKQDGNEKKRRKRKERETGEMKKKHTLNGVCWASGIRRKSENFVIVIMWTSN